MFERLPAMRVLAMVALVVLLSAGDCDDSGLEALAPTGTGGSSVMVPGSDSSPPVVTLETVGLGSGRDLQVTASSGPLSVSVGAEESFFVQAVTDDPEGAAFVSLRGGFTIGCNQSDGLGTTDQGNFANQDFEQPKPSAGGSAFTQVYSRVTVDMRDHTGQSCVTEQVTLSYTAQGRNFSSATVTTPPLTITFSGP